MRATPFPAPVSARVFQPINPRSIESRPLPVRVGRLVWTFHDSLYPLPFGLPDRVKVRVTAMGAGGGQLATVRTLADDPQGAGRIFTVSWWQLDAGREYRHPGDPVWRPEWTDEARTLIQLRIAELYTTHLEHSQTFNNSMMIERYSWHLVRDWSDPESAPVRADA